MAGCASFRVGDSLGRGHGRPPKFVLSLIGCFCHKELFLFRPFSDRKRITKASCCKDGSFEWAKGEGGHSGGQELRYPSPNFPFCTTWLGCGRTRFGPGGCQLPGVPSSQFSVESRFVWTENWELRTAKLSMRVSLPLPASPRFDGHHAAGSGRSLSGS
jgi:hypothetical protein